MQTFLKITGNGIERAKQPEKTFFIIDAKEFLQSLFQNLLEENVKTLDKPLATLIKNSIVLFKTQYEVLPEKQKDLVNLFSAINPENIQDKNSLLEARNKSLQIKALTNSLLLTEEEKRIVCLAFFNDNNLRDKMEDMHSLEEIKAMEKNSSIFKKNLSQFFAKNNANNREINAELSKPFPKEELPVFDCLLEDLVHNLSTQAAVKKAYKSCQNLVPFELQKKSKITSLFGIKTERTQTFNNK